MKTVSNDASKANASTKSNAQVENSSCFWNGMWWMSSELSAATNQPH